MTTQQIIEGTVATEVKRWRELEALYAERQRIGLRPGAIAALRMHAVCKSIRQLEALDGKGDE